MRKIFGANPVASNEKSDVTDTQLKLGNRNVTNFRFEFLWTALPNVFLRLFSSCPRYNRSRESGMLSPVCR